MRENACERMVPPPDVGRVYEITRRVYVGDCDAAGWLRLDALARYVQDIAGDDSADAGMHGPGWVVRRTAVRTSRAAKFREEVDLRTWCSGLGRCWAERRIAVRGEQGAEIDVAVLWVHIDLDSGRPARVPEAFAGLFEPSAAGRSVTARLRHDGPDDGVEVRDWPLRAADLDVLGHVNNAATWEVAEELHAERVASGVAAHTARVGWAELEYPGAIEAGERVALASRRDDHGIRGWLVARHDDTPDLADVRASLWLHDAEPSLG